MAKHAKLSASQTKTWWNCQGPITVLAHYPELRRPSGHHARLGTVAHALIELCLTTGNDPWFYEDCVFYFSLDEGTEPTLVKKFKDDAEHFIVDDDMIGAASVMVDYTLRRLVDLFPDIYGDLTADKISPKAIENKHLLVEQWVNPLPDREDTGGTGDVVIDAWPDLVEVIDYKHGAGVFVPVEENKQLRTYGLGTAQKFGMSHARVQYTIVQPRHMNGGIFSEEITISELKAWGADLAKAAYRVDNALSNADKMKHSGPEDLLNQLHETGVVKAGGGEDSHCTFCDLQAICPALRSKAEELAGEDFANAPEPGAVINKPGPNMLAEVLHWSKILDKWIAAVKAEAERVAFAGGEVPGYKVIRGSANRKFKEDLSEADIVKIATSEEFGLKEADLYTVPEIISGPKMEAMIKGRGSGDKKKALSAKIMYSPEGALKLVPESDKGDPVTVNAADDFAGVE